VVEKNLGVLRGLGFESCDGTLNIILFIIIILLLFFYYYYYYYYYYYFILILLLLSLFLLANTQVLLCVFAFSYVKF